MSDNAKNSLYKLSYKAKKDVKRPFFAYAIAIIPCKIPSKQPFDSENIREMVLGIRFNINVHQL